MQQAGTNTVGVAGAVARRPAVATALLFALGIAAHRAAPHWVRLWLGLMAFALLGAGLLLPRSRIASGLLALAVALSGLTAAQVARYYYPADSISAYAGDNPRLAGLELHVDHPPRVLTDPFGRRHAVPPKQVFTATVNRVRTWRGWEPASGQVLVQVSQPHPGLAQNQTLRVTGMLQRPAPPMNPGQFDWAGYYREQRILASVQVSHAQNIDVLASPGPTTVTALRESARSLLAQGFPASRSLDHALLRALLLGDHDPQLSDVQDQFQRTGTSHHLAISGMHVAVLGGLVLGVCRLLCMPPRVSAVTATLLVVLYGTVALPSPPVVRSVLLCVAFGVGLVSRRSLDALQLLALSVLAMLVYHPLDLFNAGFQLSFGTVLGLILFAKHVLRWLRRNRDLDAIDTRRRPGLAGAAADLLDRGFIDALAAGLVAWWVSMPLIAYHFEQLNPWAIIAGIALAPVVFAALVGGLVKVALTLLWPGLAGAWAAVAAAPVEMMRHGVDWLARLPWGDVSVPPPPVWALLGFYVLLLPVLWPCRRAAVRWCLRGGRVTALGVILFLPFAAGFGRPVGPGTTRVTLLSVGAGQCAVIEPPSGRTVLVDAGSTGLTDLVSRCLGPFLRHRRCTSLDTLLISHANYDHYSAAEELVGGYGVREVLTAATFARDAAESASGEALIRSLSQSHHPPRLLAPGEVIPLGMATSLEVLWPPTTPPAGFSANDTSLVLRLEHAGRSILFTGDIQDAAMRELLKSPEKLRSDVLVAPHHGSCESSTAAFIAAVRPSVVLSSNDRSLTSKQRALDRLVRDVPLLRTSRCGAITVTFKADGEFEVEPFLHGLR